MALTPQPLSPQEIEDNVREAVKRFVRARLSEESAPYTASFNAARPRVERLFTESDDLRSLDARVFLRLSPTGRPQIDLDVLDVARYLSAPMVSKDNLDDLARLDLQSYEALDEPVPISLQAEQIATILGRSLDPFRFPWLLEKRDPTSHERHSAIDWTTSTYALERVRTDRRLTGSKQQEAAVADALRNIGWHECPPRTLVFPDDLDKGFFMRESRLADEKCDIPTRLSDGRLLAVECKVSNTSINSVKRVLRETGGKALKWRQNYGDRQVLTAIVLSGVFKSSDILKAQSEFGIFVVFDHDLSRLTDFVRSAT